MTIKSALRVWNGRARLSTAMALALCFGGGYGQPANAGEEPACEHGANPNPALYEPGAHPFGVSMLRWSEDWWRWAFSIPAAENPNLSSTADPDVGQHGPVFFLPGSFAASPSTAPITYKIPRHKAIAFGQVSLIDDYPCPDPTWQPAAGQSLFDFLYNAATKSEDTAQITATLDGKPLVNLLDYHYVSDDLFYYKGDVSMQRVDNCITGSSQPAVSDSYFYIIKELPPGRHVLVATILTTTGVTFGPFTTNLDVQRD